MTIASACTHVVAGGDAARAQHLCMIEEGFELDFTVTHDIRIGGTSGAILVQKIFEHVIPVFAGEIDRVQADAERIADLLSIRQVFARGTVFRGIVFLPVLHEQAFDLVALL